MKSISRREAGASAVRTTDACPYLFRETRPESELDRLELLERIFDGASHETLEATGIEEGWRCLELGAGAGSIANWLADRVGRSGEVIAVDRDSRFLTSRCNGRVQIRQASIEEIDFPQQKLDLIHARHVLIHLRDGSGLIPRLWSWLKPGGWIVLEEPDFAYMRVYVSSDEARASFQRILRAIWAIYQGHQSDPSLGSALPQLVSQLSPETLHVSQDAPIVAGGSPLARLMYLSAQVVAPRYLATRRATAIDVDRYRRLLLNPQSRLSYYSVVRVAARRPPQPGSGN